jgi:phenylalanyl-tRNA synthetase beta chain
MKLSLRWVCDHLHIDWKKVDVTGLVAWFNTTVAEIETVEKVETDLTVFTMGLVTNVTSDQVEVSLPEWKKTVQLSVRTDVKVGSWYLIKQDGFERLWAKPSDFGAEKDALLPEFVMTPAKAQSGDWKESEGVDYLLDIDNKSITHRPDLWSHRGFAREIAPFLKTILRDEKEFLADVPVEKVEGSFKATTQIPISIAIQTPACKRFAALYFDELPYAPSDLHMAFRLMRVGQRPIDYVVDATNYVMFDLGQPLHAFDTATLASETFGPRMAKNGEQISLLSGFNLTLQPTDMVIADHEKALALAGIKGGVASSVTPRTRSVLLESATFDGGTVRLTSSFHKIRTEGSARFEKEVDPHLNVAGITRLVKLLEDGGVSFHRAPFIVSLGTLPKPTVIELTQSYIEQRLGIQIKKTVVKKLLEGIGYNVTEKTATADIAFTITVPTFRATKDVKQPEDIVEEVGRLIGYTTIPEVLPVFEKRPLASRQKPGTENALDPSPDWVDRITRIKNFLAFTGHMREVQNYAFLDNDFLKKIGWKVAHPVTLANPLAEQRTTLADSLIAPLLQSISENSANHEQLGFFEWDRVWSIQPDHKTKLIEHPSLAGILYQRKGVVDFYRSKDILQDLFALLGMEVSWKACVHRPQWAHRYQVADVVCKGMVMGVAGKVSSVMMAKLGGGDAFAFELRGDRLLAYQQEEKNITPPAKYQGSFLDISMMVPISTKVETLEQLIAHSDKRIIQVQLQDVFQKPEWIDEKSITFRFFVQDPQQTVSKDILDTVYAAVKKSVSSIGASIR